MIRHKSKTIPLFRSRFREVWYVPFVGLFDISVRELSVSFYKVEGVPTYVKLFDICTSY